MQEKLPLLLSVCLVQERSCRLGRKERVRPDTSTGLGRLTMILRKLYSLSFSLSSSSQLLPHQTVSFFSSFSKRETVFCR